MRIALAGAAVGLALLAGCADDAPLPTSSAPDATASLLGGAISIVDPTLTYQRLRLDVTGWADERTVISEDVVTPEVARNIGTGSALLITIPDEGRFGCTANFIWQGRGRLYLGSAGHCFLPEDRASTHGVGADYDASGVLVDVCLEGCMMGTNSNVLGGTWMRLGPVVYARQESPTGAAIGHDFGLIELPRKIDELVRLEMPVWGGPTGTQTLGLGQFGCHYGHGVGVGEAFVTKARVGVGGGTDANAWRGDFAAAPGDSGSGLVGCTSTLTSFRGDGAAGVLTHLGVGANAATGEHGYVFGTSMRRSIEMALEANLRISLVLP